MVDADYYGYRDEDDGIVVPLEQEREKEGQSHSEKKLERVASSKHKWDDQARVVNTGHRY